jgi:hypothetical protein
MSDYTQKDTYVKPEREKAAEIRRAQRPPLPDRERLMAVAQLHRFPNHKKAHTGTRLQPVPGVPWEEREEVPDVHPGWLGEEPQYEGLRAKLAAKRRKERSNG